ncbi:MAG: hypothetical protein ACJ8F7_15225 [Gemmataceae bacterium]
MKTAESRELGQEALQAFQRDLPGLSSERPGQWVAYQGGRQLKFAKHKHDLYQECFRRGLRRDEFVIFSIQPQETEITLGPVTLD